jgi:CO/xanthine dehydrogenase FAD-binding subunit
MPGDLPSLSTGLEREGRARVKPPSFEYFAPRSPEETVDLLGRHGGDARLLAGGQSLVPLMNLRLAQPEVLIDLNHVAGLDGVETRDGGLEVGAMTRQADLATSPLAAERCPLLVEAARLIGHRPIRNRGTVGGSAAHADPAAEIPTALLALDAELVARGPAGARALPARDFFLGELTTALQPDEVLTAVRLPGLPSRCGCAFVELVRRQGDFAIVGAAAIVALDPSGQVADCRLAICGAGPAPWRATQVETRLHGREPVAALLDEAAGLTMEAADPASDVHASADYRRKMVRVFARRALALAVERARNEK